jgi:hypothetical protein
MSTPTSPPAQPAAGFNIRPGWAGLPPASRALLKQTSRSGPTRTIPPATVGTPPAGPTPQGAPR